MATIITKNSATPSQVPSSLTQGELAINVTDGKLYYGSGSGNVVKEFTGAGGSTDTGSLLTTASVSLNTITFTKGDGTTFPITVNTGSGGGGSAFPYTGSAIVSGSLTVTGSFYVSNSINSVNKQLIDNSSKLSIDWQSRALRDSTEFGSVDWENRAIYDSAGGESINWNARRITDDTGNVSVQYQDRQLLANDGATPALDWRTVDQLTVTGHLIPGGTITDNTSSYDLGSSTAAWRDLYVSNGSINLISGSQSASISFTNGALDFGTTPISSPNVITTASVSYNTITFTKGNGSTFPITVDTGSSSGASKIINVIQSTDGTTVTGTTNNTLSSTILIPANTVAVGDAITLKVRAVKVGTVGTSRVFVYVNTAGTIAGGGLIATGPNAAAANIFHQLSREFVIQSSTVTQGFPSSTALISDDVNTSVTITNSNIDWTVNQYFVFSITNGSTSDSTRTTYARATIMKP